tara:strand:+ start:6617 stop:7462 length:846 start_codon:yes stop_codon:yes gene_type:complete
MKKLKILSVWKAINNGRHQAVARRKPIKAIASSDSPEEAALQYISQTKDILSGSKKVEKGEAYGYLSKVLYLAPHALSGLQVCPFATAACRRDCLGHSDGKLVFQQQSEILRTWAMHYHRDFFNMRLDVSILSLIGMAEGFGKSAAVRLNGSSDLDWTETVERYAGRNVTFYDYTKDYDRAVKSIGTDYHQTFSVSEDPTSLAKAIDLVKMGGTAAIVTSKDKQVAAALRDKLIENYSIKVNDGDRHDLRFLDKGAMVLLSNKGSMKNTSPFVWTEQRIAG